MVALTAIAKTRNSRLPKNSWAQPLNETKHQDSYLHTVIGF
jgi:hypothetical protein